MAQQWSRDMTHWGGIYFWKTISSAHPFFVFRGSNAKLFFAIYLFYFWDKLTPDRKMTTHLTSDMLPPNDKTSHSHRFFSHTWTPRHGIFTWTLQTDLVMHDHQGLFKKMICTCQPWFCSCVSFILRLSNISISIFAQVDRIIFIQQHGSLHLYRPSHFMDGGDADQWWPIPSNDRISLDLSPIGQHSTESGDGGTHRICATDKSRKDQHGAEYHQLSFLTHVRANDTRSSIMTSLLSNHFRIGLNLQIQLRQLTFHHIDHFLRCHIKHFDISQF